ncbi:MAG: flagellar type III secretion system pore protein FliP [Clostridiales bacterium]|jgi:flagellar biosynthetic protein FliP|nr:flagellar type III secretion system pore protein FliP [Clostridia bacterium]NLH57906.1 flagellar type III secretion system pore protein FliP [Clostridiales bacterium]
MTRKIAIAFILVMLVLAGIQTAQAAPYIDIEIGQSEEPESFVDSINILILLTLLTLVPSFMVMVTSFTRIIVVLSFLRNALATQQTPPNQVLIGLAIFITIFIMAPVYGQVMDQAVDPYMAGELTQEEAMEIGSQPIKEFMLKQTREKDLALFVSMSPDDLPEDRMDVKLTALIPAFIISELKTAFIIGFLLYIPFIVIDLVVASILMSMGMFMLPPATISLPFKLLLFILVDGWHLLVKSLVEGFA